MNNFKYRLARFMYGRYGIDRLYYVLAGICIAIIVFNNYIKSPVLDITLYALLVFSLFRVFSRNIQKRRGENEILHKLTRDAKKWLSFSLKRIKEARTGRFRKCPGCGSMLRLPRRTGKHTAVCPKCSREFEVQIFI